MAKPKTTKASAQKTEPELAEVQDAVTVEAQDDISALYEQASETIAGAEAAEPVIAEEPVQDDAKAEDLPEDDASSAEETPAVVDAPVVDVAPSESAPVAAKVPERRGGFFALFLGGVCAAAIGAGALIWAFPQLPPQISGLLPLAEPAPVFDPAPLQGQIDAQAAQIAALIQAGATDGAANTQTEALTADLAAMRAAQSDLQSRIDAFEARLSAVELAPGASGEVTAPAIDALRRELDAMRGQITQATEAGAAAQSQITEQVQAAKEEAEALRAAAEAEARKLTVQAELTRLSASLDSPDQKAAALTALQNAGVSIPATLSGDIPSLASLQETFGPAAQAALKAARLAQTDGTVTDRIGAFLLAQTGARSLKAQEGDGPDAILSRAQEAVDAGNLQVAVTELGALPDAAKEHIAEWLGTAQKRIAAQADLDALIQSTK